MTFDEAVLAYFELDTTHEVEVEIVGGREVQIGDYTWDTDPGGIEITAYSVAAGEHGIVRRHVKRRENFDSLPDLWAALNPSS